MNNIVAVSSVRVKGRFIREMLNITTRMIYLLDMFQVSVSYLPLDPSPHAAVIHDERDSRLLVRVGGRAGTQAAMDHVHSRAIVVPCLGGSAPRHPSRSLPDSDRTRDFTEAILDVPLKIAK